ncbi:toll/interleukin-1 receptor domain-containing protein [Desulfobacterales bacterium HSG2]|nr:toll/interleukin-1 receptor domain-containing protein [Desulfobacterales bacterium HSG2]
MADNNKPKLSELAQKVFISYAREDIEIAGRLYDDLKSAGVTPWMDEKDLLPGQDRKVHITKAIWNCKYFIAPAFKSFEVFLSYPLRLFLLRNTPFTLLTFPAIYEHEKFH